MTNKAFLLLVVFGFLISGCVERMRGVKSDVSVFHNITEQHKGNSVVVLPFQKELESSLEFQNYKKTIENNLQKYGFSIVQEKDTSDFIAFVSYGVDGGKDKLVSSPVYGSTGGGSGTFSGSSYNYGTGGTSYYSGTTYSMPTFGVVGSSTSSITQYTRQLAMDLVETSTLESKKINKVYEGRVKSSGSCSMISYVMPEMLESLFRDFPRKNGSSETIIITYEVSRCGE
tara:strand:- start:18 stop:704 length:687 start_codon:yes stop_codon:yes gene_type:complete